MTAPTLPHALDRTIVIRARRETVFRYFTDSSHWAAWWGAGSMIDPQVGGKVFVRYPNAIEAAGEVLALDPPSRIAFTFGFASGQPIPVGASRVTIALDDVAEGTRLRLVHEFPEVGVRDAFVQGWRYQLSVFANVVANQLHAGAAARVDGWFAAWSQPDGAVRNALVDEHVAPIVSFRDRFSMVTGVEDLKPHLEAVHRFMPGTSLTRRGDVRQCQGTVLAEWVATGPDGAERGRGTNVFTLDADGRIAEVVGLWS
jgi:uncharacterized protein YndB with AHSA1/START domain